MALAACERLRHEIEAALGPNLSNLVFRYYEAKERAESAQHDHESYLMIDGIAAHFPDFSDAIRCLGQHAFDSDYGRCGECGAAAYPPVDGPGAAPNARGS